MPPCKVPGHPEIAHDYFWIVDTPYRTTRYPIDDVSLVGAVQLAKPRVNESGNWQLTVNSTTARVFGVCDNQANWHTFDALQGALNFHEQVAIDYADDLARSGPI